MLRGILLSIIFLTVFIFIIPVNADYPTSIFSIFEPQIISASVEPLKVVPGDRMVMTAEIEDNFGIKSVIADMDGIETIKLVLVNGSIYQGTWQNNWIVHSTEEREYVTKITAANTLGFSSSVEVKWSDPNLTSGGGTFFDGFESGSFSPNWTTTGPTSWIVDDGTQSNNYEGSFHAHVENTDGMSVLEANISTEGYQNINFSFYAYTSSLDPGEYISAEWYNGTNWIQALPPTEDIASYTYYSYLLDSSANNNPDLKIRFNCTSGVNNELCAVDNVNITGLPYLSANSSLLTTTINTGENTTLYGNCTCSNGNCNDVNVIIQNSTASGGPFTDTTTNSDEPVYVNVTSYYIGSLSGDSDNYYFNITANKLGTYYFRVQCNTTNAEPSKVNSTADALTVNQAYGYLNVTLSYPVPASTTNVVQNSTFNLIANVSCASSNPTAICDEVNGTARYNITADPDTPVNTTEGDVPFWTNSGNPQTCGKMNVSSGLCNLTWSVNATGTIGTSWKVDVSFTSNESSIDNNDTSDATISIRSCTVDFTLQWSSINFGSLNPSTTQNAAPGNADNEYNITVNSGSCNLDLYIKGTNLTNETLGTLVGTGNITWGNETSNYDDSHNLTSASVAIKKDITANTNVTTWYWINVPAVYAGYYNGTITITGVENGEAP